MIKQIVMSGLLSFSILTGLPAEAADFLVGKWLSENGKAHIEVYPEGDHFNGKIIWLKEPNNADGTPKLDTKNPDEASRARPLVGLNILQGLKAKSAEEWADGTIYDPENGKTYKVKLTKDGDKLKLRGYIGVPILGRSQVWTRLSP